MGGKQSILQSNSMQVRNNISQISNQKCVNLCLSNQRVKLEVIRSTIGHVKIGTVCSINGASCSLKATLSNEVINDLTNTQDAKLKIQEDPWTFLNNLTSMGGSQTVEQYNYQRVTNNITQQMNSVCMNKSMNSDAPEMIYIDAVAGNLDVTTTQTISNTSCIIDNSASNITNNNLSNSQTAAIIKEGIMGGLGFLLVICAMVVLMHHNKQHRQAIEKINYQVENGD